MGKTGKLSIGLVAVVALALSSGSADATYVASIQSGGSSSAEVNVNDANRTIDLDFVLTGDSAHIAQIFDVSFSQPGLTYNSYLWADPFPSGSGDDGSSPFLTSLPATIGSSVFFTNFLNSGEFGTGTLLTLSIEVPSDFALGRVEINPVVTGGERGFTLDGENFIPISLGETFVLNVTPEPATLALLGIGGIAALRRRRTA